jgi:hypothetical protein
VKPTTTDNDNNNNSILASSTLEQREQGMVTTWMIDLVTSSEPDVDKTSLSEDFRAETPVDSNFVLPVDFAGNFVDFVTDDFGTPFVLGFGLDILNIQEIFSAKVPM